MRPAAMTEIEQDIILSILDVEIALAVRSMGNAKDWTKNELESICSQILGGFRFRFKSHSFASILLFFKMRRARIEPCNKPTYGLNPTTILDEFNDFAQWQRQKVAEYNQRQPSASLSLPNRTDSLAKSLDAAPDYIKQQFAELRLKLDAKERERRNNVKEGIFRSKDMQTKRLFSCMQMAYLEMGRTSKEAEAKALELLATWGDIDGNALKVKIDEIFPPAQKANSNGAFMFKDSDCKIGGFGFKHGDGKSYHINSDKPC